MGEPREAWIIAAATRGCVRHRQTHGSARTTPFESPHPQQGSGGRAGARVRYAELADTRARLNKTSIALKSRHDLAPQWCHRSAKALRHRGLPFQASRAGLQRVVAPAAPWSTKSHGVSHCWTQIICYRYPGYVEESRAYLVTSWLNNQAHCQCGYQGKRRWFRGNAVLDVIEHCATTKHKPVGLAAISQMQAL